ncbi:MAG: glycosyltransferase family 2 protein [Candidatus Hodarchaeota archaeon]
MTFLFWLSLLFIAYTYAGYPCLLFIWGKLFPKKTIKSYIFPEPMVSVIVVVRDEEDYIRARIENLLEQKFPSQKLEILIISDGSKDSTNDIVRSLRTHGIPERINHPTTVPPPRLRLITYKESKGKPHAINLAVNRAKGEFLVFTDARQRFEPNAIKELIANFSDPDVGCVSGELNFHDNSDTTIKGEMGFYWSFEKRIRKMESSIHSVPGATGAIYAIRRSLFHTLPERTLLDDVFIPMKIVLEGYRALFDGQAIAYDTISKDFTQEKKRKVRTLLGNYQLLGIIPDLLSPKRNPIFLQFISHKILRLFVPFFYINIILSSHAIDGIIYKIIFAMAITVLLLPFTGKRLSRIPHFDMISTFGRTFVSLNYFAILAFLYLLWPGRKRLW